MNLLFNLLQRIDNMTRLSLDTSPLPHDVFTYTDQAFFDFVQSFCGTDEADLLFIQAIRSIDSLLSVRDIYSIFALDSEDLGEIQARCGFKSRNGCYTVRPGIKSSIDHLCALLREMQKEMTRMKRKQSFLNQSAISFQSTIAFSPDSNAASVVSKKTEAEHRVIIEQCIEEWCVQNKNSFDTPHFNLIHGVDYQLDFTSTLDRAKINCCCGTSASLYLGELGNFKVKIFPGYSLNETVGFPLVD